MIVLRSNENQPKWRKIMRILSAAAMLSLITGIWMVPEVIAADGSGQPTMKRGSISEQDDNARRSAQLKARIKAINEKPRHSGENSAKTPMSLEQKSVRGSEQIKAKMKAVRESKSRRWLQDWYHDVMKKMEIAKTKKKATFKKKLAQEKARRLAKKKARENSQ